MTTLSPVDARPSRWRILSKYREGERTLAEWKQIFEAFPPEDFPLFKIEGSVATVVCRPGTGHPLQVFRCYNGTYSARAPAEDEVEGLDNMTVEELRLYRLDWPAHCQTVAQHLGLRGQIRGMPELPWFWRIGELQTAAVFYPYFMAVIREDHDADIVGKALKFKPEARLIVPSLSNWAFDRLTELNIRFHVLADGTPANFPDVAIPSAESAPAPTNAKTGVLVFWHGKETRAVIEEKHIIIDRCMTFEELANIEPGIRQLDSLFCEDDIPVIWHLKDLLKIRKAFEFHRIVFIDIETTIVAFWWTQREKRMIGPSMEVPKRFRWFVMPVEEGKPIQEGPMKDRALATGILEFLDGGYIDVCAYYRPHTLEEIDRMTGKYPRPRETGTQAFETETMLNKIHTVAQEIKQITSPLPGAVANIDRGIKTISVIPAIIAENEKTIQDQNERMAFLQQAITSSVRTALELVEQKIVKRQSDLCLRKLTEEELLLFLFLIGYRWKREQKKVFSKRNICWALGLSDPPHPEIVSRKQAELENAHPAIKQLVAGFRALNAKGEKRQKRKEISYDTMDDAERRKLGLDDAKEDDQ